MARRHARGTGHRRMTDWSGIHINEEVTPAQPTVHITLWTPISEDKHATVVRIVGDLHVFPDSAELQNPGALAWNVFAGIQVVNRAQGGSGMKRAPNVADDLEGGEWLWLRAWTFNWVNQGVTGDVRMHTACPDLLGANPSHLDIRVKRKLDLSQDELILTVFGIGGDLNCEITGMLRMLLMT